MTDTRLRGGLPVCGQGHEVQTKIEEFMTSRIEFRCCNEGSSYARGIVAGTQGVSIGHVAGLADAMDGYFDRLRETGHGCCEHTYSRRRTCPKRGAKAEMWLVACWPPTTLTEKIGVFDRVYSIPICYQHCRDARLAAIKDWRRSPVDVGSETEHVTMYGVHGEECDEERDMRFAACIAASPRSVINSIHW
jgi:hypothetical protein